MDESKQNKINAFVRNASIPRISKESILGLKVSLPSVEIQKRIVKVLDNFDAICSDLNIGLPAEIEARKKQYEYYRDLLLTFAETGSTLPISGSADQRISGSADQRISAERH